MGTLRQRRGGKRHHGRDRRRPDGKQDSIHWCILLTILRRWENILDAAMFGDGTLTLRHPVRHPELNR
jgi:hypothetical protein